MTIISKGRVFLGAPNGDSYSGSSMSSLLVVEWESRSEGDESASYAAPDDATADILSSIQTRFGRVPKHWIWRHICPMFWGWSLDSA